MTIDTERYRTGLKRFWAAIVDGIVFMPFLLVDRYFLSPTTNEYALIGWQTFTIFIPVLYSIITHYKYGQTMGKWVAGIKVLDISETRNISLKQSVFRDEIYLLAELIGFLYYAILVFRTGEPQYLFNDFNDFASTPLFILTLLELLTMLKNTKRWAVHDFIAKSVVVRIA